MSISHNNLRATCSRAFRRRCARNSCRGWARGRGRSLRVSRWLRRRGRRSPAWCRDGARRVPSAGGCDTRAGRVAPARPTSTPGAPPLAPCTPHAPPVTHTPPRGGDGASRTCSPHLHSRPSSTGTLHSTRPPVTHAPPRGGDGASSTCSPHLHTRTSSTGTLHPTRPPVKHNNNNLVLGISKIFTINHRFGFTKWRSTWLWCWLLNYLLLFIKIIYELIVIFCIVLFWLKFKIKNH